MSRGISGGEKKHVTTSEMMVGPKTMLFMDVISAGLDSSTTFKIVKCLQQIVHLTGAIIFMSLLQSSPETFNRFDDVFLLFEGQIVYQGPKEDAVYFFERCGFKCPERKICRFLAGGDFKKRSVAILGQQQQTTLLHLQHRFRNRFNHFHIGKCLKNELLAPFDKSTSHKMALVFKKHSVVSKWDLFKANLHKEWLLIRRNSFVNIFKTVRIFIVVVIVATLFLRTHMRTRKEQDDALYVGALLFSMTCNTFNNIIELSLTIKTLPVFYKQRDLIFHPTWAFTLPGFLLRIPISMVEVTFLTATTYYLIGLAPEPSR